MARGKKVTTATVKPGNLTGVVAGGPGKSLPSKPMPGPGAPGQPVAMKKALARKKAKSATGV